MKFLVDECLHTSLALIAREAGYEAQHVAWIGKSGWKDWHLIDFIVEQDWTFVTNNAADFRKEHGEVELHAGLIIIMPQLLIDQQRAVFRQILVQINNRELINTVIEVSLDNDELVFAEYDWPK